MKKNHMKQKIDDELTYKIIGYAININNQERAEK